MNKTTTTARTPSDQRIQGSDRLRPDADNPAHDPDNVPLTNADFARMKPVPKTKSLRRALALTQEEFSTRYHIPVGTLRDWEQGRSEPDAPAKALLKLIAADPDGSAEKLKSTALTAAE